MSEKNELLPVEIPIEALSSQALDGVMDNFINREGTDYGLVEVSYEKKVEKIKKQLQHGDIKIIFDPNSETVTLLTMYDWKKINQQQNS